MTTPAVALGVALATEDEPAVRRLLADRAEDDRVELQAVARAAVATAKAKGLGAVGHLASTLLAAYGVLPVTDIRKLGWRANHLPDRLEEVLRRRSSERLGPIVDFLLDDVTASAWPVVRSLVREGLVARPDRPSYTIAMLAATRWRSVADLVQADPGLLEVEAWRLFEVEGGGEDSLANHEKFFGDRWGELYRDLAGRDPAVRERLLDASLAALARDFATYRAGWFSRFHESLNPTDDERAPRAEAYLRLLRSRVGPTVSFATAALVRIERAGGLLPDALLDRIGPVLMDSAAGAAKTGLGLVGRAGEGSTERARRAAIVATDGLANPSPDIQRVAVVLIGKLVPGTDDAVARAMATRLPDVAASQRPAITALLTRLGAANTVADVVAVQTPSIAAVLAVAERPSPTDPARAIEPLTTIEALIDVAVSVLETGEPADDVERVVDAVGRLTGLRDDGFLHQTAAIARRARTILDRSDSHPFSGFDARADVAAVLLTWATGQIVEPARIPSSAEPGAGGFLSARARELALATAVGRRFESVAAPTHRGGWIDPVALVGRLAATGPASHLDLVAALLRLAPDGRAAALVLAAGLAGEMGSATRYALGGHEPIGPTAAWWVSAARVRAPGHDDAAVEARHPRLGPDAGLAARIRLRSQEPRPSWGGLSLEIEPPLVDISPRPAGGLHVDLPTVAMLRSAPTLFSWTGRSDATMLRWMATIRPGDRESWSAVGGLTIARNIDWWSAEWANRAFLEPFVDPTASIGPHARVMLAIALGAKEAGERGLAADVVGLALADGRLAASGLADGLTDAAAVACDRPNRWAVSLADVATRSDHHAAAVADAVAGCLPALADRPAAKLVPLLRLLDELLAGPGSPPAAEAGPLLEVLAGAGGQAGRLARSILSRALVRPAAESVARSAPRGSPLRAGPARRRARG